MHASSSFFSGSNNININGGTFINNPLSDHSMLSLETQASQRGESINQVVNKVTYKTNLRLHKLACANFFAGKVKLS